MKQLKLTLLTIAVAMMCACGASTPSPGDGPHVIEERIKQQSNGLIKLVSFEKTNGQQGELAGVKFYGMEYKAVIEFLDDCMWGSGGPFRGGVSFEAIRGHPRGALDSFSPAYFGKQQVQKGQRVTVSGELAFEKAERCWQLAK